MEAVCSDGRILHSKLPMQTADGSHWTLDTAIIDYKRRRITAFRYTYTVCDDAGNIIRREWEMVARAIPVNLAYDYVMHDAWHDIPPLHHLYTNAYTTIARGKRGERVLTTPLPLFRKTLFFRVSAPGLPENHAVALCGSHPILGGWNTTRYIRMQYVGQTVWALSVNAIGMELPVEYKFVVVDVNTGNIVAWEDDYNRTLHDGMAVDGQVSVVDGGILRLGKPAWKAAGVAVPVFALRSEVSYGAGDFGDLRRLVDWAVKTGMKVIQVLPVCDTGFVGGWKASCPYNVLSVYALHPRYVDIEAAGLLSDTGRMAEFRERRRVLNGLPYCDYEAVCALKKEYLKELYAECGEKVTATEAFANFVETNAHWLHPYAAFSLLVEDSGTLDRTAWPVLAKYDKHQADSYLDSNRERATYIYYVQYVLHCQLLAAADYARANGVALKGDLPIGVSPLGADAWVSPHLFNSHKQAGAPPDFVMPKGQIWGFPTYNWKAMLGEDCVWWRTRIAHMEQYFDAVRLDHVLGYFRIWEIPDTAVFATLGHFSPAMPFTPAEIETFGLTFRREFFTTPFINDKSLDRIFGAHTSYVRDNYLIACEYGLYKLRPEYATQRKIQERFAGKNDENSLWIRDGLYRVAENVLFIEDSERPGTYHPRINAFGETAFEALNASDREAFTRLHNHYYYERHDGFWGGLAMRKLSAMLRDTQMLVCAEDLGMLSPCVEEVLKSMRILSLCVQTMPKEWGREFCLLNTYPYLSVASFSTHDMPSLRLWWEEDAGRTGRFYSDMLQKEGKAPSHLPAYIAEEIVARHLYSPSMLCILSLQDWLSMDNALRSKNPSREQINRPGNADSKWDYRMDVTIEQLLRSDGFNERVRTMIVRSRR